MLIVIASLAVAICAFIIYALERKSKSEPIVWESAGKLSIFGGLLTAGIVFAITADPTAATTVAGTVAATAVASTASVTEVAQEMFSGVPTF